MPQFNKRICYENNSYRLALDKNFLRVSMPKQIFIHPNELINQQVIIKYALARQGVLLGRYGAPKIITPKPNTPSYHILYDTYNNQFATYYEVFKLFDAFATPSSISYLLFNDKAYISLTREIIKFSNSKNSNKPVIRT